MELIPSVTPAKTLNPDQRVAQLMKSFLPTETPISPEFRLVMAKLITGYSEAAIEEVCGPSGICLEQKFMPTLSELKERLERAETRAGMAKSISTRRQQQFEERKKYPVKTIPCYEGPIEEIKPGDELSIKQQAEYREFMKKKHPEIGVKLHDRFETAEDTGQRPFGDAKRERPKVAGRPTYDELIAKLPPSLRIHKPKTTSMTREQFLAKFPHVTPEVLDACPDSNTGSFKKLAAGGGIEPPNDCLPSSKDREPLNVQPETNPFDI